MARLLAFNRTIVARVLPGRYAISLPASTLAEVDGASVDVTGQAIEWSRPEFARLDADRRNGLVRFEWTDRAGFFDTDPLIADIPEEEDVKRLSVRVATAAALAAYTRTANVIRMDAAGALAAIDGVTPADGDLVLLLHGAAGADNGPYAIRNPGDATTRAVLERIEGANTSAEFTPGLRVYVEAGTQNGRKVWYCTNTGAVTLNTTAITFGKFDADTDVSIQAVAAVVLAAGDLVYVSGWNVAADLPAVSLCDADSATAGARRPQYVARAAIALGATGQVFKTARLTVVAAGVQDDPVFLSSVGTTTNTMTLTAPVTDNADTVVVGRVSNVATTRWDIDLRSVQPEIVGERSFNPAMTPTNTGLWTFNGGATFGSGFSMTMNGRLFPRLNAVPDLPYAVDTGADDIGIVMAPTIARVLTLPTASAGRTLFIRCAETAAGSITVTRAGLDAINVGGAAAVTTLSLQAGRSVLLIGRSALVWDAYAVDFPPAVIAVGDAVYDFGIAGLATRVATGAPSVNRAWNLPASTGAGRAITVKNLVGSASTITVTRAGADLIDGAATHVLAAGNSATYTDAVAGTWIIT